MVWHDFEHVLRAWSILRKQQARLELDQQVAEYLNDLDEDDSEIECMYDSDENDRYGDRLWESVHV